MRDQFTNFTATAAATLAENLDTANERALDAVIDANRKLVEFAVTTADRVAEQISFELPFADRLPSLPTPAESGERYLDFVERAVAVNREFNDRIVAMLKSDTTHRRHARRQGHESRDATTDRDRDRPPTRSPPSGPDANADRQEGDRPDRHRRKAAATRPPPRRRSATKTAPTASGRQEDGREDHRRRVTPDCRPRILAPNFGAGDAGGNITVS